MEEVIDDGDDASPIFMTYVGKTEDEEWLRKITPEENDGETSEEIYRRLVENIGIFRWQNAHGFRTGQNRGLQHLRQKYANIKELSCLDKGTNLNITNNSI